MRYVIARGIADSLEEGRDGIAGKRKKRMRIMGLMGRMGGMGEDGVNNWVSVGFDWIL